MHLKRNNEWQDKVNTADSAFIFLISLLISQNIWSGWSGWKRWSCLVFARKIARMILIQNIQGLMGPQMINMAFMPLYMWEMWDVTPVTHEHTDEQWKVVQYSVWAESAKGRKRNDCSIHSRHWVLSSSLVQVMSQKKIQKPDRGKPLSEIGDLYLWT